MGRSDVEQRVRGGRKVRRRAHNNRPKGQDTRKGCERAGGAGRSAMEGGMVVVCANKAGRLGEELGAELGEELELELELPVVVVVVVVVVLGARKRDCAYLVRGR